MLNLQQLQYAIEVEKTGSISRAAENLYMNQPNLSKAIKELEESLGLVIFHRTPQGVTPTESGRNFLAYAREIVQKADDLVEFARRQDGVSLLVAAPPASYLSQSFANTVSGTFDRVDSFTGKYSELPSEEILRQVLAGEYTLGIVRLPESDYPALVQEFQRSRLAYKTLYQFTPQLTCSTANPLVREPEIHRDALGGQTEITFYSKEKGLRPSSLRGETSKYLQIQDRTNQYLLLSQMPNTYLWGSPAVASVLEKYDLFQREAFYQNHYLDVLIHLESRSLTDTEKLFVREVQKTIDILG